MSYPQGASNHAYRNGFYIGNKPNRIVTSYYAMLSRCYRKEDIGYPDYGGKGIRVCRRWRYGDGKKTGRECFILDMGMQPTSKHTLDRKDNKKNYSPDNCRWATRKEQAINRSTTKMVTLFGRTQHKAAWLREFAINDGTVLCRMRRGMTFEEAITKPLERKPR